MFQRHRKKEEVEKILTVKDGNNKKLSGRNYTNR